MSYIQHPNLDFNQQSHRRRKSDREIIDLLNNTTMSLSQNEALHTEPKQKWYSFLLPANLAQLPIRMWDMPLRRNLFQKAKPGNEQSEVAHHASIDSEMRASGDSQHRRSVEEGRREEERLGDAVERESRGNILGEAHGGEIAGY